MHPFILSVLKHRYSQMLLVGLFVLYQRFHVFFVEDHDVGCPSPELPYFKPKIKRRIDQPRPGPLPGDPVSEHSVRQKKGASHVIGGENDNTPLSSASGVHPTKPPKPPSSAWQSIMYRTILVNAHALVKLFRVSKYI